MAQGYHKFEVLSFWHQEFKQASPNNEMLAKYPKSCCIIGLGLKSSEEFMILKTILWLKRMKNWLKILVCLQRIKCGAKKWKLQSNSTIDNCKTQKEVN